MSFILFIIRQRIKNKMYIYSFYGLVISDALCCCFMKSNYVATFPKTVMGKYCIQQTISQRSFSSRDHSLQVTIPFRWSFHSGDHYLHVAIPSGNHSLQATIPFRQPFPSGNHSLQATFHFRRPLPY